ncbi:adh short domain containing protein [Asbolus verrucosus]|uniref:Adh short domain containing protein n=1 Tax=Asbolus verrucosus TaxID=1661398 RepID=A0A482VG19_ASBVE|nr:adh short domain containing protein [Asbolus verrucosus]
MVLSMDRWCGKVAVVTGASAGIGVDIVQQLVEEGVLVVGVARRVERVEELAKKLQGKKGSLYALKADISVEEDILNAFKWTEKNVGPVHILINNAGVLQDTNLIDGETKKWKAILDVNVLGLCIATREAVRCMRANNIDGHIIHINSFSGHIVNYFPYMNVYAASKHAVTALTETLRSELNTIGSNQGDGKYSKKSLEEESVSPGVVATEIDQTNNIYLDEKALEEKKSRAALATSDCADAVIYALSTSPNCQVHDLIIKPIGEKF